MRRRVLPSLRIQETPANELRVVTIGLFSRAFYFPRSLPPDGQSDIAGARFGTGGKALG